MPLNRVRRVHVRPALQRNFTARRTPAPIFRSSGFKPDLTGLKQRAEIWQEKHQRIESERLEVFRRNRAEIIAIEGENPIAWVQRHPRLEKLRQEDAIQFSRYNLDLLLAAANMVFYQTQCALLEAGIDPRLLGRRVISEKNPQRIRQKASFF